MKTAPLASALIALSAIVSTQACGSSGQTLSSSTSGGGSSASGGPSASSSASSTSSASSSVSSTSSSASGTGGGGTGGTGGGDAGACSSPVAADPLAPMRQACTFTAGAKVKDTLGLDAAAQAALPIKHIIVMMKENRSFDHLLGQLNAQGQPGTEAIPSTFTNLDAKNMVVAPFHETTTCIQYDPDHQWTAMHNQVDGGKMDGFVTSAAKTTGTDGHFAMGWYDDTDLPFYYFLARTYALNDRHFASARSGTFPDRNFLLLGTTAGIQSTGYVYMGSEYPNPSIPTIFNELDAASVTWGAYGDGSVLSGTLGWNLTHPGAGTFASFITALDDGTLPQVAFVDGIDDVQDDHPTANLQVGEAWTKLIYEHAVASKLWPSLAILWTYDEGGGFADHVPPPNQACLASQSPMDTPYFELGVRVPMVVISPWARPHYVSHVVQEHTAMTRFIEAVFNLPALTGRDANSDALLDMFDFSCPPALLQPPPAPASGTKGCGGSVVLTTGKPVYPSGEAITINFSGAPGNNGSDWIAIFTDPATGPTAPTPAAALAYEYVDGTHVPGVAPSNGSITIDTTSVSHGTWPLPAGQYIAYYLLNASETQAASVEFTVN